MSNQLVVLTTAVTLAVVMVWFDARCLADLARTSPRELRYFDRNTWALLIVISFPIGPMLYLRYAKGPRPRP
jgi:hypothetical protein